MSETVTLEDVWQLFKASDERMARLSQEADRRHAETEAAMAFSRAEADRRHAETEAAMAFSRAEADRRHAKTEAALQELSQRMGRFSNRLGEFVEEMVAPAAGRLFTERGIPVHLISRNVKANRNGRAAEYDIIVINGEHLVAVEVKSRPRIDHIDMHLQRLAALKEFMPDYRHRKVLGAVAGMTWDDDVAHYAYRKGLFVLGQSGETVAILNDDKFQPKEW